MEGSKEIPTFRRCVRWGMRSMGVRWVGCGEYEWVSCWVNVVSSVRRRVDVGVVLWVHIRW